MLKRRAIIVVTFIAGLYYLLEFLLPPRLGGSPDADGVEAATMVKSKLPGLSRTAWYLAYTGIRNDRRPVLMGMPLERRYVRTVLLAPAFNRHDDYRGCTRPQFVAPDRLYYIGLGWDDRTPRVCLAMMRDGRWQPRGDAVLREGKPGEPDASGIGWVSVQTRSEAVSEWRMWYVGRQGDVGTVCLAVSPDGLRWEKRGPVALAGMDGVSADCVNAVMTREGTVLWVLGHDASGERWVRTFLLTPDGRHARNRVTTVDVQIPPELHIQDLRIESSADGLQGLATLRDNAGKTRIAWLASPVEFPERRLVLRETSLVVPGSPPWSTVLSDVRSTVDDILVVIGAFAVGLGLIGLAQVHGKRVLALQKGWPESTAFFVAAIAMAAFTVYARLNPEAKTWGTKAYDLLFYGLLQPLGSSMFSLLAAYLVSAAYRAFRVRTFEGGLLAASATLIMLGQVPVGNWLTQNLPPYLQIPKVMAWVLFVSNTAVVRAVNFGIFVGALATALRVWLSMDRASMRSIE